MFLKRTAIITFTSLFLAAGCISVSSHEEALQRQNTLDERANKITELEASLTELQADAEKNQSELEATKANLEKAQKEKAALEQQLRKKSASSKKVTATTASKKTNTSDKTVLGQTEWIYVAKAKESFRARIDTGAATSSINAVDIQEFERDGKDWVKFNITHDENGEPEILEARVVRYVKIIQSSDPDQINRRPVIELLVRIGGVSHKSEFTLTDRQHMDYAVLIGRSFIQDVIVVDVSKDYIYPKYQPQDEK